MKFLLAMLVWIIMGAFIAAGIIMAVNGSTFLAVKGTIWLILFVLAFILMVAKFGCLPPKEHH